MKYLILLLGASLGASGMYLSKLSLNGPYSIERGYYNNWHEFFAFSCERTKANGDAYADGIQRFSIHTGPSINQLAKHVEEVDGIDAKASPEWHKPLVVIDYNKNHEVCVKNMWTDKINHTNPLTCFDLYEMGER